MILPRFGNYQIGPENSGLGPARQSPVTSIWPKLQTLERIPMLAIVFLSITVDLIGFGIVIPLLPFYAASFGADPLAIALLASVFSIAQFISAPLLGGLTDRVGRRKVFLICTALSCIGYLGLAFADTLLLVFLARIVNGIGAGKISIAQAIVADCTTPETRARGMGMVGAAFGLGMVLGPVLGGLLTGPDPLNPNFHLPALAAAAASLCALVLASLRLRETLVLGQSAAAPRRGLNPLAGLGSIGKPALVLILMHFSVSYVFSQIEVLFPLFTAQRFNWHAFEVGIAFACIGLVVLAVQGGLIGPVTRLFGENALMRTGLLGLAAGTLMVIWVQDLPMLALSILLTSASFAFINPSLSSLISRAAGIDQQGLVLGMSQSMAALGRVLGPLQGGWLFQAVSIEAPYLVCGVLLLLTLLLALLFIRRPDA
ncbi:MFS transporter [Ferrovibrio sp.]|uniref:MFS transporter n=1 Tax=Ferrovibrio sp. TaxID=1917215 RepID=UPI0025BBAB6A|nr:MFS transporter [Ferrovibrio sp.]